MNRKTRDRVIEVSARVKKLRDELAKAEAELDSLLRADDEVSTVEPAGVTQVILEVLRRDGTAKTAKTIGAVMSGPHNMRTVRSTLARLASEGKIERVGVGLYRALPDDHEGASEAAE